MSRFYSPSHYDQNLVLKVPPHLMLVIFYVIRHAFLVFLAFSPLPKLSTAFEPLRTLVASPAVLVTDLPGFLLLIAWLKRTPEASEIWRVLWANGRMLLTVALLGHVAMLLILQGELVLRAFEYRDDARLVAANLGMDLLLVYYVWRVPIVRDVFADFPRREAGEGG